MRFIKYINESGSLESLNIQPEEFVKTIKRDCSKYFTELYPCFLYRGMEAFNAIVGYGIPRLDRKPKDTHQVVHEMADEWFLKKFGWRARSQGLFVSTKEYVGLYGDKYIIFPVGDYKYVFSPKVHDLMNDLDDAVGEHTQVPGNPKQRVEALYPEQYPALKESIFKTLDEAEYTNTGLKEFIVGKGSDRFAVSRTDREVMFNCKGYYFMRYFMRHESKFQNDVMNILKGNNNEI